MKNQDIEALVIDAFAENRRDLNIQIGVGPRLIATVIEETGIMCDLVWFKSVEENPEILKDYDIILVSGFTASREIVSDLLELIHNVNPCAIKIIGGPIVFDPDDYFSHSGFDMAIVGEAEQTIKELIESGFDRAAMKKIKGLAYKTDGKTVFTGYRDPVEKKELERIPDARYLSSYPHHRFSRVSVECVRGCSNFKRPTIELPDGRKCIGCKSCESEDLDERLNCPVGIPPGCGYCCVPAIFGPPRSREMAVIVKEIQGLIDAGATQIALSAPDLLDYKREELIPGDNLTDPFNPPPNYPEIEKLLYEISALKGVNENVFVSLDEIKPTLLDKRILETIARYLPGSTLILVCESGSDEQLKEIGRPFPVKKNVELTKTAEELGLVPLSFFINSLPNQTPDRTSESLVLMDQLEKAGCHRALCYKLAALPATAFHGMGIAENKYDKAISERAEELNTRAAKKYIGKNLDVVVIIENHVFEPGRKKTGEQPTQKPFNCALGFLKQDPGIYSPMFIIMDPDGKIKKGSFVTVIAERVLSPRAVLARLIG